MADDVIQDEADPTEEGTTRRNLFRAAGVAAGALAGGGLVGSFRAGPAGASGHDPQFLEGFQVFNNPKRQYDSRQVAGSPQSPSPTPTGRLDGGTVGPGLARTIALPDTDQPEPQDIIAVLVNITVTETNGTGFLSIYPAGATRPNASIINWWGPGQIHANQVVTAVSGAPGGVKLVDVFINSNASTHVILDLYGYFLSGTVGPIGLPGIV